VNPQRRIVRHLYVHIPFCAAKCNYCAFYSEPAQEARVERFLAALAREIEHVAARLEPETLFFGGGTPSILTERQLDRLLAHLHSCIPSLGSRITSHNFEWTFEDEPRHCLAGEGPAAAGIRRESRFAGRAVVR